MAEEAKAAEAQAQAQEVDATDWQAKYEAMRAHSREWEKKAKENQGAADELEQLKSEASMRAEKAEAELNELKARAERAETVSSVATSAGVPPEFVAMLNGADADELEKQVARALELLPAYPTRTDDGGAPAVRKKSNAERFAEALGI